jgi:hypothetical protein
MTVTALPTRGRFGYSLGSLVSGAFGTVPGLLLLPYLTDTLGVAAGLAGLLVLLPKAWDVLVNPVAGRISDGYVSAAGPRRPFLLAGGLAVAVLFALIFAGPVRSGPGAAGYVAVLVPISPATLRPSTSDIATAIGPSTVLVAVSAPAYPHGVVDPVSSVVLASVAPRVAQFAEALTDAAAATRAAGPVVVPPVDLSEPTPELVCALAAQLGLVGGDGPVRMAPVNAILAAAPPRVREWLLVEFLSLLQSNADL